MTDWNRNGIDDAKERKKLKQKQTGTLYGQAGGQPRSPAPTLVNPGAAGSAYAMRTGNQTPQRISAAGESTGSGKESWNGSLKAPTDDWWNYQNTATGPGIKRIGNRYPQAPAQPEPEKTLADYLRMATELIGANGGGGGFEEQQLVNYDPERGTLRNRASENDARLEAMYRQLRGSIDADAPVLQQGYQEAIDKTAATSAAAQQQTQQATDAANAQNNAVLANLGIQQAQGNQIIEGRDLNTQSAGEIGRQASRGQAAGNRLVSNQATALSHNTNIGNAAGLEGNLQRAANGSRLQALLSDIDMQERTQNAEISRANAMGRQGSRQNQLAQQMEVANQILGFDRYGQERADRLQQNAAELAAKQQPEEALPDLGSILQAIGQDPTWLTKDPDSSARLLDVLRKLQITQ